MARYEALDGKRMKHLARGGPGKRLDAREPEPSWRAIGHERGSEEPIPHAERYAEIAQRRLIRVGVVPDVHRRAVEEVLQGADRKAEVGVVEVTDGGVRHGEPEQH